MAAKGMKAISLWQPYASLIAWGEKRYETRSWQPKGRLKPGELVAIHAAKHRFSESDWWQVCRYTPGLLAAMRRHSGPEMDVLPHGQVVAFCKLIAVHRVEDVRDALSDQERAFGDYRDGRFAWELEVVKLPEFPVPVKGQQGVWYWDFSQVENGGM